jgi:hypothetical protein
MYLKNYAMKLIQILVWVFGLLAGVILILAVISFITGIKIFGVNHVINLFHVANTCILAAIGCILYLPYLEAKSKKGS